MNKFNLFIILSLLLYSACGSNEKKIDHDKLRGELEYRGKHIYFESGTFDIINGKALIDIAGDGYAVSLQTNDYESDTGYDLSDEGNELLIYDGNEFTKITDGHISLDRTFSETTSGSFYFKYKDADGEEQRAKGAFYKVPRIGKSKQELETFIKNKFMMVDVKKGAITNKETECQVGFNAEKFVVLIPEFEQYNIEVPLKKLDINSSSAILYPIDKSDIKLISIDKMNNKQTTVLMKNGNSMVIF